MTALQHLTALHEAATPGPWECRGAPGSADARVVYRGGTAAALAKLHADGDADAALIAAMRNALPAILVALRAAATLRTDLTPNGNMLTVHADSLDAALAELGRVGA